MSINVKCKCNKEVYSKGSFKVYGFIPTGGDPIDVNRYGSFSISGEQAFDVGQEYYLSLSPIENPKYPYSYNFDGFVGIGFVGEEIKVDPKEQIRILSMYMEESQAKACTEGYPNFLELILANRENEIDLKKIHGVGNKLLAKYCDKIRGDCKSVLFAGILSEYGATDSYACVKASINYSSPTNLREALNDDPYGVLCKLCERKTKSVDRMLEKQHPELLSSKSRCISAVNDLLDEMESEGSTRCNAKVLVDLVKEEYPECIKWIGECITANAEVFFDSESKYVSKMSTFEAECKIARELKDRMKNIEPFKIDREKYRNLGTMRLSDEQMNILDSVSQHGVSMLTGNAGCVDADTEFFTGHGWKRIADYEHGDKVLQYNEDGTAELVEPIAYIKKPCDYLWHFETPHSINQTVCEEHRILYKWKNCPQNIHETNVLELKKKSDNNINWGAGFITQFYHYGEGMNMSENDMRVMIAVMAEGHFDTKCANSKTKWCTIRLKKERKIERLEYLLKKANIEYKKRIDKFDVTNICFYAPERRKVYGDDWWNVNEKQAKIVCEEVVNWDGTTLLSRVNEIPKPVFRTTEKQSADYMQYIFTINGWQSTIVSDEKSPSRSKHKPTYRVSTKLNSLSCLCFDTRSTKTKTEFVKVPSIDGYKYCFTVPSHMLVLRRKNCIFITGNCGKTSATNALVKMLEDNKLTYTLLAPTGCAAKRLRESTARPASTIHMHMTMDKCVGDVLIIDEFSQVGVDLLGKLFATSGIQPETRLVFVCDPSQLASISCGNLAQDIIDSGIIPITRLTKVFRYNSSGIATVVTDTRNGVPSSIESEQFDDYTFEEQASATSDVLKQIKEAYAYYLEKGYGMKDILCLCPYNKGALGTRIINAMLQQEFNDHEFTGVGYETQYESVNFKIGDKVINKRNNYNAQIYDPDYTPEYDEFGNLVPNTTFIANGDIGTVVDVDDEDLVVAFDESTIVFSGEEIKHLRLAYAISVHSSQGSESPVVIALMLRQHLYMINRNIEYVAFSRAKTELCIIGDTRTIANGMKEVQNLERDTWLCEMLKEDNNENRNS